MDSTEKAANDSKTGEIPKVQDVEAMKVPPYYWSWYGFIFSPVIRPQGNKPADSDAEPFSPDS